MGRLMIKIFFSFLLCLLTCISATDKLPDNFDQLSPLEKTKFALNHYLSLTPEETLEDFKKEVTLYKQKRTMEIEEAFRIKKRNLEEQMARMGWGRSDSANEERKKLFQREAEWLEHINVEAILYAEKRRKDNVLIFQQQLMMLSLVSDDGKKPDK